MSAVLLAAVAMDMLLPGTQSFRHASSAAYTTSYLQYHRQTQHQHRHHYTHHTRSPTTVTACTLLVLVCLP